MKLTIPEAIAKAVDEQDARLAGVIVDALRGARMNYDAILAHVQTIRPAVTAAAWDALLYEADRESST